MNGDLDMLVHVNL